MTLGQALRVLHERKRIAAPWLPGMASTAPRWRAVQGEEHLHAAAEPEGCVAVLAVHAFATREPDTTDPATVGCLAALAREAWREPRAYARPHHPPWRSKGWDHTWAAEFSGLPAAFVGATEGDAWARALIQLADELTP